MSNKTAVVAQQQNLPYANPYLEAAAEGGNKIRLAKFIEGEWIIDNTVVKDGTEYIAHIDKLLRGYVKFKDGKVVDRILGRVADGFKLPKKDELPDRDPANWEKDEDGELRDPWSEQWYLPLISVTSGVLVTYVTGTKGGIGAIADLCQIYGHTPRNGLLPIIALHTRSYRHKRYNKTIKTPDLQIVGWDGSATTQAATIPVQAAPQIGAAHDDRDDGIPPAHDDMDDTIPF